MDAYGHFVAELAPWNWFLTLTYDPRDLSTRTSRNQLAYTRVGQQAARKRLTRWFHDEVRKYAPAAQIWCETELHESGQPHHHAVAALPENAPWLRMRTAWWDANGWGRFDPVADSRGAVARYVCKYATKATTGAPFVAGLPAIAGMVRLSYQRTRYEDAEWPRELANRDPARVLMERWYGREPRGLLPLRRE